MPAKPEERPESILPFSGQLGDVAYRPARVVPKTTTMADASRYFASGDFEYLVVHENRIPIGVVHKYDLVRHNMTRDTPGDTPVMDLMTRQVITVQKDRSVIESLVFMIKHDLKFLLLMDGKEVMGVVGQEDWLALQSRYPTELLHKIAHVVSLEELAELRGEANDVVWHNFETEGDAVSLTSIVTVVNDAITRRVITLALAQMAEEGHGEPPVPFAWIGMGSEGREAQTITTDQDNGLIYKDVPPERKDEIAAWFETFAHKAVAGLEQCGFKLCAGNIMATNPDLRGPLSHWKLLFERIITKSGDEELFEASIYFDFRCLFGSNQLVDELREFLNRSIEAHSFFLRHLVETTVQGSGPPVGTFRWKLYSMIGLPPPPVDIKRNALVPLDAAVRVLALLDGTTSTRTLDRLQECLERGRMSKSLANDVRKAFDFLLRLRFKIEFSSASEGKEHDHMVEISKLLPAQARYLDDSLRTVRRLQDHVYHQVTGRSISWSVR